MARYSSERKAALLKKLLPPINMSVAGWLVRKTLARSLCIIGANKPKTEGSCAQGQQTDR